MGPTLEEDTVYYYGSWDAAQSLQVGQGLGSVSRDEILRAVGKQRNSECECNLAMLMYIRSTLDGACNSEPPDEDPIIKGKVND
jgi:hypothetical protein